MATATASPMSRGQLWVRALRAPFLVASVLPVFLGGVLAWQILGQFQVVLFLLTLVGAVFVHLATNMLNDNFDFRSGNDLQVRHQNPFAGGGRVLTQGVLNVNAHLSVALGFLVAASAIGLYLVLQVGLTLLWIGLAGVAVALFYVGPPLRLAYYGVGELLVGLSFGPLLVLGTYFVQTQRLDSGPFLLSISLGLLVTAILWINEFPDVEADVAVGKRTLMARLGHERSVGVYASLLAFAYGFVLLAAIAALVPWTVLLAFLTLPVAKGAWDGLRANYRDPMALIPANAATIQLTLLFGILTILGVALGVFV